MKVEIGGTKKSEKYNFITDDARLVNSGGAFLLTHHNKKFKVQAEENGCSVFLDPAGLFQQWELSDMKIIGITGTNGKTTVTNIIAHILKQSGKKVAVSGTEGVFLHTKNNSEKIAPRTHTTPEILTTLYNLKTAKESGAEFFVMEVSSHGIFQKRIEGLDFAVKVFTNISQDHLDFHSTMEEYAAVKSSFFSDAASKKVINIDDDWIQWNSENTLSYSLKNTESDLFANNTDFKNGISADIFCTTPGVGQKYKLRSAMIGEFNLYNILASVGAVLQTESDIQIGEILQNLADFRGVSGRMESLAEKTCKGHKMEVFSDYAHTPDAIENVLDSISDNMKVITVVGAGGDRDSTKRPLMARISCEKSDFVFLTSDNPRTEKPEDILADMEQGIEGDFDNYRVVVDRKDAIEQAIRYADNILENNESVMLAILGKGDEDYIEINREKIPYSDRKEVEKNINI